MTQAAKIFYCFWSVLFSSFTDQQDRDFPCFTGSLFLLPISSIRYLISGKTNRKDRNEMERKKRKTQFLVKQKGNEDKSEWINGKGGNQVHLMHLRVGGQVRGRNERMKNGWKEATEDRIRNWYPFSFRFPSLIRLTCDGDERENWPRRASRRENWLNFLSPKTSSSFSLSISPLLSSVHSFIQSSFVRREREIESGILRKKREREELIHEFWYKNEYRTSLFHPLILPHASSIVLFLIIFIRLKLSLHLILSHQFFPTLSGSLSILLHHELVSLPLNSSPSY